MSTSCIAALAARIAENTARAKDYDLANSLPLPSFGYDGPLTLLVPPQAEPDIEAAGQAVIYECQELSTYIDAGPEPISLEPRYTQIVPSELIDKGSGFTCS